MAVTQYIGARYVPIFADPAEWSSAKQYDPLTIVLHEGNSFTSKQFVPVGVDIDDADYWAETGNYNAQVEAYRQEVQSLGDMIGICIYRADSFEEMLQNQYVEDSVVMTLGRDAENDYLGYTLFKITSNATPNDLDTFELPNGLFAVKIGRDLIEEKTYGIKDTACARSSIANWPYANKPTTQVMGFTAPSQPANYSTRDGVGEFVSIYDRPPILDVSDNSSIIYAYNSVTVPQTVDIKNVMKNSVIDTKHVIPCSGLVTNVDYENNIIYVQGWYAKNTTNAITPQNGIGFYSDNLTFIWATNIVATVNGNTNVAHAAIGEYDMVNRNPNATMSGITFVSKSVVKNEAAISSLVADDCEGFKNFIVARGTNTVIADDDNPITLQKFATTNSYIINSIINGDSDNGFRMRANGDVNRLFPRTEIVTASGVSGSDNAQQIINSTSAVTRKLRRPPQDMDGVVDRIINTKNFTCNINCDANIHINGITISPGQILPLLKYGMIEFTSFNNEWYVTKYNGSHSLPLTLNGTYINPLGSCYVMYNDMECFIHIAGSVKADIPTNTLLLSSPMYYGNIKPARVSNVYIDGVTYNIDANGNITNGLQITMSSHPRIEIDLISQIG